MTTALLSLRRRRLIGPAVLILSVFIAACGDDDPGDIQEPPPPAPVASVTITAPSTTIQVGQTLQLVATAYDADGAPLANRAFDWAPSNPTIATVFASGLVTGVAPGEVQISATSEGITGTIVITIIPAPAATLLSDLSHRYTMGTPISMSENISALEEYACRRCCKPNSNVWSAFHLRPFRSSAST